MRRKSRQILKGMIDGDDDYVFPGPREAFNTYLFAKDGRQWLDELWIGKKEYAKLMRK